jgi:hypothetical protein
MVNDIHHLGVGAAPLAQSAGSVSFYRSGAEAGLLAGCAGVCWCRWAGRGGYGFEGIFPLTQPLYGTIS